MVYKAKKDKNIYLIPIFSTLLSVLIKYFTQSAGANTIFTTLVTATVVWLFMLINMLTIRYIVTDTELTSKTCMFKTVLKLDKITEVKRGTGGYTFSTSSMEQLKLRYHDGQKFSISPENREEFEEMLRKKMM